MCARVEEELSVASLSLGAPLETSLSSKAIEAATAAEQSDCDIKYAFHEESTQTLVLIPGFEKRLVSLPLEQTKENLVVMCSVLGLLFNLVRSRRHLLPLLLELWMLV